MARHGLVGSFPLPSTTIPPSSAARAPSLASGPLRPKQAPAQVETAEEEELDLPKEELLRLDDGTPLPEELTELRALLQLQATFVSRRDEADTDAHADANADTGAGADTGTNAAPGAGTGTGTDACTYTHTRAGEKLSETQYGKDGDILTFTGLFTYTRLRMPRAGERLSETQYGKDRENATSFHSTTHN